MRSKKVLMILFIVIIFQLMFCSVIVNSVEEQDEQIYLNDDFEEYSENYKKYLQLSDEEKEKIRCNSKKV